MTPTLHFDPLASPPESPLAILPGDLLVLLAFVLLVAGVVGSVLPAIPGAPISIGGVLLYWWTTGEPGTVGLLVLLAVGVAAIIVDWFGGAVAARASGTSTLVSAVAGLVGLVLMVVIGPVGLVVGIAGTVFLATFYRERDATTSLRRAVYATAGVLASAFVQVLITASILLSVLLVHVF